MIDVINSRNYIMEMAAVRGAVNKIGDPGCTFYFSRKNSSHGIRVKICWNKEDMDYFDGYMMLHGNYEFKKSSRGRRASSKQIEQAREFFKKYKVLFSAVWEGVLSDPFLYEYFVGITSFDTLVRKIGITDKINNVEDLEKYVREHNLFNMND